MFAHVRYLSVNSFNGYELKSGFLANCRNFAARVRLPSFLSYMGNISIFSADITPVVSTVAGGGGGGGGGGYQSPN
jgi:hypothetical protein